MLYTPYNFPAYFKSRRVPRVPKALVCIFNHEISEVLYAHRGSFYVFLNQVKKNIEIQAKNSGKAKYSVLCSSSTCKNSQATSWTYSCQFTGVPGHRTQRQSNQSRVGTLGRSCSFHSQFLSYQIRGERTYRILDRVRSELSYFMRNDLFRNTVRCRSLS